MKNKKNVFGTPPYEKYPNSKTIRAVFSGPKENLKNPQYANTIKLITKL